MKRALLTISATATAILALAPAAHAAFGFQELGADFIEEGAAAVQAGSHPDSQTVTIAINTAPGAEGEVPDGDMKDLVVSLPAGFVGDPNVVARCSTVDFVAEHCPDATTIGATDVTVAEAGETFEGVPVYSLPAPPGTVMRIGFVVIRVPITVDIKVSQTPPYNVIATALNTSNAIPFYRSALTVFGAPPAATRPFLTMPRSCTGPLRTGFEGRSWQQPGTTVTGEAGSPGMTGCSKLPFGPTLEARPTTLAAESATGLDLDLRVEDTGIASSKGLAASDIRDLKLTLPEGMTANPSSAEGLEVCSEADLARETIGSDPGEGCPDPSKLGSLEAQTPLLDQAISGSLFLAEPYENEFGSLLAVYAVFRNEQLGILIKQAARVEPDPETGQLVSTVTDIPQFPLSRVSLRFREGARSPLVSPPECGSHEVIAEMTPWSGGPRSSSASAFEIAVGPGGGPCPGGAPPFEPGFEGGTLNNSAGAHSAFSMRLTRRDGDQDLTRFAASLPPGLVARLAGTAQCPEASIAAARARGGVHAGAEELASPSCPASSEIGSVLAGAGVGSILTYVPGKIYLAGPYNGAPLSAVGIVPAVAGPFDVGVVVTRFALRIDPRSAEVTVDGAASDPIPHILAGIPLKVRDIRAFVDKPDFTLNPTSCEPFALGATLWGGGADVFGSADDLPVSRSSRFQAADCGSLGFGPRLGLKLKGGTRRGGHPALTGIYTPRPGDANLKGLVVRLPRSAFLDQAHIRTICTRVQFAAKTCPKGAVYGRATAWTPLLEKPLSGPVYLRSSDHNLPDFVAALHGLIDVEAVARIDSKRGGIRATFADVPDAPLSRVVVRMRGAKKGLIVNSRNICFKAGRNRAAARFSAQNAMRRAIKPVLRAKCGKRRKAKRSHRAHRSRR